jgi:signal transduction histidine kinase
MIIAILVISWYINFTGIKKEIRYLELSDTLRSKSLQLRRHEKNFFLYGDLKEIKEVHAYLKELKEILSQAKASYKTDKLLNLENKIKEYEQRFKRIELIVENFREEFNRLKPSLSKHSDFFQLTETTFLESPLVNAEILKRVFLLDASSPVIRNLEELNTEINALRKDGEEILIISKALDKSAREKVERYISLSQTTALFLFSLFFLVGLGTSFVISHSIVKRLKILTRAIEKTGKGDFSSLTIPVEQDEVGVLIKTFNKMENDLMAREEELKRKNEELLQSRKLASIGTLASGVAHELNNPLNNIYICAQVLSKEIDQGIYPKIIGETVKDIFSQTLRVKRIVNDLLEFARGRTPELTVVNITSLIKKVLNQMAASGEMCDVKYNIKTLEDIELPVDVNLMEQVFVNLFSNAIDAMEGKGILDIAIDRVETGVQIKISDTGKGIPPQDIPRIFDPFFTTKEKGTGLGLAIVYGIIEKHRGKIEVKSIVNKGTTFTVTLPGE